jgi:hypothetical protein
MTSTHRAGKPTIHRAGHVRAAKTAPKHAARRSAEARSVPAVIVVSTALVALLNYAFALILLWVLPAGKYAVVASITALLLMFGTVAGASAPRRPGSWRVKWPYLPGTIRGGSTQ